MTTVNGQVGEALKESETHFNGLLNQITVYFKDMEDLLEVQKYMSYNALLTHRGNLEGELRVIRDCLESEINELMRIGMDIQNNMEAVESVEGPIFASIMQNYKNKVIISQEYNHLDIPSVLKPTLIFPEPPSTLYSLADKINIRSPSGPPTMRNSLEPQFRTTPAPDEDPHDPTTTSLSKMIKKVESLEEIEASFAN